MNAATIHVKGLAQLFRSAMNAADRSSWGAEFESFPAGACGDTSLLLGEFLYEQGCGTFDYIHGVNDSGCHHAWIELGGLIVDITIDQFPNFDRQVYVSRDRVFHSSYEIDEPIPARLDVFGAYHWNQLSQIYAHITRGLRVHSGGGSTDNVVSI